MRRIRRINPSPKKSLTPEQEASEKQAEILYTSARIFELGVSAFLNRADEYMNDLEMETAAQILNTACTERRQARILRDQVRNEYECDQPRYIARRKTRKA
jgi:hypothetical protein